MRALMLAAAILTAAVDTADQYRAAIDTWRADRIAEITGPDGWLAVRGLFWLNDGPNSAGSDPSSAIRLPARVAKQLGVFTLANGQITFTAAPGATVTSGGKPITTLTLARGPASSIESAGVTLTTIRRGDKMGLRMRDPESPNRTGFKGLKYYPLTPAYRFRAKFVAYEKLKQVPVPNVLGMIVPMESPGYVEFTLKGKTYRLEPVYETSQRVDLFFLFKDLTSRGGETYEAGRFLHTPLPVDGFVDLDFNRAYNPPCAFTEYATCPLPVKENHLPVAIRAGELNYHLPK